MRRFLAFLALASAALLAPPRSARADDPATPPQPATTPEAPPPPAGPDEKIRQAVLAAIDEVRDEVAKVRGLAWKTKVPADLMTREQLKAELERMIKEELDPAEYERNVREMRRLGMLGPKDDPLAMEKKALEGGILGFFDPKKKKFFAIDGASVDGQRPTVFHELCHALDDQYCDLEKLQEAVKKDGDRSFALKCVIEGCAEHAREAYMAAHPDVAKRFNEEQREMAKGQVALLQEIPAFLIVPTLMHYQVGPAFVGRAVGDDFAGGMERLFADMPVSQEQVLHPGKFLTTDRDLPQKITWSGGLAASLGEGWTVYDDSPAGELDLAFWLDFHLGGTGGKANLSLLMQGQFVAPEARKASAGWDGCRTVFLEKKDQPLAFLVASVWDTPNDAKEAAEAFRATIAAQYGSEFKSHPTTGDGNEGSATWTGPNGAGRVGVEGDRVFLVDGVPADRLDTAWTEVRKTKFERDAKDTFDPAKASNGLAGAAWKAKSGAVGWKAPGDGWKVEALPDEDGARLAKGDASLRVSWNEGDLQRVVMKTMIRAKSEDPSFNPFTAVKETKAGTHDAAAVSWEGATKNSVVFVPLDGGVLVFEASAAASAWGVTELALKEALKGLLTKEE